MTDLYKLEWIHSINTIQRGMSQSLNKDAFMDTIIVCQDGVVTHNKLVLGLIFPELCKIPMFEQPLEQTLIMPDWSVGEVQTLISQLFPDSDLTSAGIKEDDIETGVTESFEHFLETDTVVQDVDFSPRTFGMRRGRGRPPLSNTARMPPRFTCDYCHKGFFYRSMLTAHEKLHTGGSRETCELCGAEYSTRQNLKNHMIKHHGEDSFTPRKRGRPPLDPERRAAIHTSHVVRPGYRGRGRPPLMTKHRGLTHFESYNNITASTESDLSAESFMEQKLEDGDSEIDEEKNLDAIRETSQDFEPVRTTELEREQESENNIAEEIEDIKPDISTHNFNNQNNGASISSTSEMLPQQQEHNNSFQNNQHYTAQQLQQTLNTSQHFYNRSESHSSNNGSPSESSEREYQVGLIFSQLLYINNICFVSRSN